MPSGGIAMETMRAGPRTVRCPHRAADLDMNPLSPTTDVGYRPEIDGLRAIAVLLVLVYHFGVLPIGDAGFIGVDVFFVISGYLITSIVLRQLDTGRFTLGGFYAGRIRRLAPAFVVVLLGTLAWGAWALFPAPFVELLRQAAAAQAYLINIYLWRTVNYFGLNAGDIHLLHLWSLAVEEQFYLFFPLALLALHRHARRYLWPALGAALLLSFALNLAFVASKPEATFYLLPTRAWELLAGAVVAGLVRRQGALDTRWREALLAAGLALLVVALAIYRKDFRFPGSYALLPVLAASLLLYAVGTGSPPRLGRLLSNAPMVYVGRISYPLYLVHWPVHVYARQALGEDYGLGARWQMFALSFVLAALVYHLVEQPVRTRAVLRGTRPMLAAYGAAVVAVFAGFGLVRAADGLPARFAPEVLQMAAYAEDRSPALSACQYEGADAPALRADDPRCRIGAPDAPLTWLVFGDSHAWAAHGVFDAWLRERGEAGVLLYRNSCPPSLGLHVFGDRGRCLGFNEAMLALAEGTPGLDRVFLVSTWLQGWEGRMTPAADRRLDRAGSEAAFDQGFTALVERLSTAGKQVYVWEPLPGAKDNVPLSMARAMQTGRHVDLDLPRTEFETRYRSFFETLARQNGRLHARFAPAELLCDRDRCAALLDGRPVYFDGSHLAHSAAPFWAAALQHTLGPAATDASR